MKQLSELENILDLLRKIDEENFETNFAQVKNKMIYVRNEIIQLEKSGFFIHNPEIQKKIEDFSKLISKEYDNLISLWRKKIKEISEMLISSQNEKKILNYKR